MEEVIDVVESGVVENESETELVEKFLEKLTKERKDVKDVKKDESKADLKAKRISQGRKVGAMTRNKKTDEMKKKALLFDKYLDGNLSYENVIENGFKMKAVKETIIPNVVITKTKTEPIKEEVQKPIKKKVQRKKVVKKVVPKVEPVKSTGKMTQQELDDFLNS